MILLANLLYGLAQVLNSIINLYLIVLIVRIALTWVNADPYNQIVRIINSLTDPVLYFVRRKVPLTFGQIDFSPILIFLLLYFFQAVAIQSLIDYSMQIKAQAIREAYSAEQQ
jgi:YggT family protein